MGQGQGPFFPEGSSLPERIATIGSLVQQFGPKVTTGTLPFGAQQLQPQRGGAALLGTLARSRIEKERTEQVGQAQSSLAKLRELQGQIGLEELRQEKAQRTGRERAAASLITPPEGGPTREAAAAIAPEVLITQQALREGDFSTAEKLLSTNPRDLSPVERFKNLPAEIKGRVMVNMKNRPLDDMQDADIAAAFAERDKELKERSRVRGIEAARQRPLSQDTQRTVRGIREVSRVLNEIRQTFSQEEINSWVGLFVKRRANQLRQTIRANPRFARFNGLINRAKAAQTAAIAGKAMSQGEMKLIFGFIPTGDEASAVDFNTKLDIALEQAPLILNDIAGIAAVTLGDIRGGVQLPEAIGPVRGIEGTEPDAGGFTIKSIRQTSP